MFIKAIYEGMLLGVTLAFLLGPSFFALIQTSTFYGLRPGIAMAVGIFLSDLGYVSLAYLGASQFFNNPDNKVLVAFAGGIILIIFGTYTFFNKKSDDKKPTINEEGIVVKRKANLVIAAIKGFLLNTLNPSVFIFWIGWIGLISPRFNFDQFYIAVFFSSALATVFTTDCLKVVGSHKLGKLLTPRVLEIMNKIVGLILIGVGIYLILKNILEQIGYIDKS